MALIARWLDSPPAGWEEVRRGDPGASPAHRPALGRAIAAALPGHAPAFVTVEEGAELLGGAPAVIERRAALHWIHAMPFSLSGAPLARPGAHARVDQAVAEAIESRARALGAVGGTWTLYRPEGPAVAAAAAEIVSGESRVTTAGIVDLAAGAMAALRAVDRDTRHSIRAARSRGLRWAEEPRALDEAFALYAAQARRWSGHRPRSIELLRRLLAAPEPAGRLFTVRDARGLLAATVVLVSEHEWMPWWSGTHPEARRHHGFALLLWGVAERAAEEGCRRLNLGASAGRESVAAFKSALGARDHAIVSRWIGPDHAGGWGRVVGRLQRALRAGRDRGRPA